MILKIAYGYTVSEINDYFVKIMEDGFHTQALLTKPGRWLVDVFPICKFLMIIFI